MGSFWCSSFIGFAIVSPSSSKSQHLICVRDTECFASVAASVLTNQSERGYSQTSTTVWWTPTTSYASVYITTSTSTVLLAVTQQPNVIVTLTSYIPCPVTSTVWVYECNACNQPVTVTRTTVVPQQTTQAVQIGTTTQTLYTTTTQGAVQVTRTYTSNGYVIIVVDPTSSGVATTASGAVTTTVAGQAAIINSGQPRYASDLSRLLVSIITTIFLLIAWL